MKDTHFYLPEIKYERLVALHDAKNGKAFNHLSPASAGSFSWSGTVSTRYWADPKENLIGILYINIYANPYRNISERFKILTYQALVD